MKTNITKNVFIATLTLFFTSSIQAQVTHDVSASGMSFTPANITINLGDTVRWTNAGGTHNVNGTTTTFAGNPESFGNSLGTGWVFDHKFTVAGSYDYRCDQHFGGGMTGRVIVVDPTANIEEIAAESNVILNIYPIPASNEVTIELSGELLNVTQELALIVFDMSGKEVLSQRTISTSSIKLNTAKLENGIYIINLMDGNVKLESHQISINR